LAEAASFQADINLWSQSEDVELCEKVKLELKKRALQLVGFLKL
jgi:hypothetical protein